MSIYHIVPNEATGHIERHSKGTTSFRPGCKYMCNTMGARLLEMVCLVRIMVRLSSADTDTDTDTDTV